MTTTDWPREIVFKRKDPSAVTVLGVEQRRKLTVVFHAAICEAGWDLQLMGDVDDPSDPLHFVWGSKGQPPWEMAQRAARLACQAAGLDPEEYL